MKKLLFLLLIGISFTQCVYDGPAPTNPNSNQSGASDSTSTDTTNSSGSSTGTSGSSTDTSGSATGSSTGTSGSTTDTSNKTTYIKDVQPLLNQLCMQCHSSTNPKEGFDISTYSLAKNRVDKIINSMTGQYEEIMPPSGRVSNDIIQTIKNWKSDGLLEGQTASTGTGTGTGSTGTGSTGTGSTGTGTGTTANVTYTNDIQPILAQQCTACHGASNPSAGLSLTSYTSTKAAIAKIISRISLLNGQTGIMPPAGRMSDANIQKFKDWNTQGLLQ